MKHNGNTLSWTRGRLLNSYGSNSYTYNVNGIRTSKTAGGITKTFILDGDRLIAEKWSDNTVIYYVYNANGIAGFVYNGIPYVYQKNVFGDIVAIYNNAGGKVAGYRYNAYGECYIYNPELTANSNGSTIAEINPFRYRGYYYDTESGLYYLQSRYYDPAMGRFLNADTVEYIDYKIVNGINLYTYALNNPLKYYDPTGHFLAFLARVVVGAVVGAVVALITSDGGKDLWKEVLVGAAVGALSVGLGIGVSGINGVGGVLFKGALNFSMGVMGNLANQRFVDGKNPEQYDEGAAAFAGFTNVIFGGFNDYTDDIVTRGCSKKGSRIFREGANNFIWSFLGTEFEKIAKPWSFDARVRI